MSESLSRRVGALTERDFRSLYVARAFSLFGDGLVPVALAFGVLAIDNSPTALGAVLASRSAALVVFLLVGGVIADRLPRRLLLITTDLLRCCVQAVTAILLITRSAQIWQLAALTAVYGLGDAFFRPTSTGIMPQVVSRERLQQANALVALTQNWCTILGPVIAGVIVVTSNAGWAFVADAATFLLSALFVARLPVIQVARSAARFHTELLGGWREFRSRKWLLADGFYAALGGFAVLAPFLTLGPVVAKNHLGGAGAWASITAAFGVGAMVGGIGLLRFTPRRPLLLGAPLLMLLALPAGLLAGPAPAVVIAAGAFFGGAGLAVFNTIFETTVQQKVPEHMLSRVASIDWMLSASLLPLGQAIAGPLSASIGTQGVFLFSVVWIVASTGVILSIRDVRQLKSSQSEPANDTAGAVSSSS